MNIILASKSGVRKKILDKFKIETTVIPSYVDEDQVKESLLHTGANPEIVSKNLAELKSVKVSVKNPDSLVIGADSVISLNNEFFCIIRHSCSFVYTPHFIQIFLTKLTAHLK